MSDPTLTPEENALVDAIEESISAREAIETVISSLAADDSALVNRTEAASLWTFKYGTVDVFVQLTGETDDDRFTVWSPVLPLPARNEDQLTRKLLELNWLTTFEARFAIADGLAGSNTRSVIVTFSRTVADLSAGEISRAITLVASIADENDEPLLAEFGG